MWVADRNSEGKDNIGTIGASYNHIAQDHNAVLRAHGGQSSRDSELSRYEQLVSAYHGCCNACSESSYICY